MRKKDGKICLCIDFRNLNLETVSCTEPMMTANDIYSKLSRESYFSKCDMTKGYWQIPLDDDSNDKTNSLLREAFANAIATFNTMVRKLLKDQDFCKSFVDNILCHTPSWEHHGN